MRFLQTTVNALWATTEITRYIIKGGVTAITFIWTMYFIVNADISEGLRFALFATSLVLVFLTIALWVMPKSTRSY